MKTARLLNPELVWQMAQSMLSKHKGNDPFLVYVETRGEIGETVLVQPLFFQRAVRIFDPSGINKKCVEITANELMRCTELSEYNQRLQKEGFPSEQPPDFL